MPAIISAPIPSGRISLRVIFFYSLLAVHSQNTTGRIKTWLASILVDHTSIFQNDSTFVIPSSKCFRPTSCENHLISLLQIYNQVSTTLNQFENELINLHTLKITNPNLNAA